MTATLATPFCPLPFFSLRLTSEGFVYLCCFHKDEEPLGNLLEQSLDEIWNSAQIKSVRKDTVDGKLHRICQSAGGCPYKCTDNKPAPMPENLRLRKLEIGLPNTHCNIGGKTPTVEHPACIMCERSLPGYRFEQDRLPEILHKIKPMMPGMEVLHIQGVAEPFWQDAIFKVLEALDYEKYQNQTLLTTCTNGTVLGAEKRKRYLSIAPRSNLSLSIDAATATTYEKIRRLPNVFHRVIENAIAYGHERNPKTQIFQIQHNINTLNVHEVVDMVRIAKEANCDTLEFNPTGGHPPEILVNAHNSHLFQKAEDEIRNAAEKYGQKVVILRPLIYNSTLNTLHISSRLRGVLRAIRNRVSGM